MIRKLMLGLAMVVIAVIAGVLLLGEYRLRRPYPVSARSGVPPATGGLARGAHLYRTIGCAGCHGEDGGGALYLDAGPIGIAAGPNLTRGRGGVGGSRSDLDLVRAIREGVRPDGRSLLVMPSAVYAHLTDEDLGAIVAHLRQLPPVDREPPATRLRPLGLALLATGTLDLRAAPKVSRGARTVGLRPGPTAAYGRYLADIASCRSCHRPRLTGGPMSAPGAPPAPDITPVGLAGWSEADFVAALREGKRPDGTVLHEIMPWREYRHFSDEELTALWRYLQSSPEGA